MQKKLKKIRLSPVLMTVVAIAAPLSLSLPATGTTKLTPVGSEVRSLPQKTVAAPRRVALQNRGASVKNVVVETVSAPSMASPAEMLAQTPEGSAQPNSTINQTPETPTTPIIRPPGTEGAPQQETPNRIQVPIDSDAPSPPSNPNNPAIQPSTPANSQPNQTTPNSETPVVPGVQSPGTEGAPQQETPNQIQVPINPGTPSIENNINPPASEPTTPATPAPGNTQPETAPAASEPRVLVSEVVVTTEQGQLSEGLQNEVYRAIQTQPGRITTRSQLQEDINAVFATGFFSNVRAQPEDTPLGVRVSFVVQPNPVLRDVNIEANAGTGVESVLSAKAVDDIFREQYGSILNLRRLQEDIKRLNQVYQDQGYVLAQVVDTQVAENGNVTLQVAEGVVEDIQVNFRNNEGEETNDEGEPIEGRTRPFIITRELELKPGQVFNRNTVQRDLQRVYGLGLFEDVNVSLNPGQDPRKVTVVVNVDERNSGSIAAGAGFSSASGLFGTVSYQQQNLGGNNQKLGAEVQIGQRERLFDISFTDPWIAGDPYRTSYTVNAFQRRSISLIFSGNDDDDDIELVGTNDRPRVRRLGGAVNFTRPLGRNPLRKSEWTASAGVEYQRVSIRDDDGDIRPRGELDGEEIDLSFSGDGTDDLFTFQLGAVRDRRDNPLRPTSGSLLRFGVEQSVPIGKGSILLNRLRGSYSQYIPVNFTNFNNGPETLAFNLQAGTILGDLPPYEAFSLGGSNSVRGFDEGNLGSGRSFVQASAEYRFPILSAVGGALFVDAATDLGTGDNVPGNPAGLLDKPGSGLGYGVGIRVQSPLGPLRIDYGFNTEGDSRINFGIGERF